MNRYFTMIRIAGYFFSCMCPKCGKQDEEGPERASGFSYSLTGIPRIFLLPHTFVEHGHRTTSQVTARSSSVCYQVWRSRICFFSVFIGDLSCPFPRFGLPDRFHHFTGGYCGRALMGKGPLHRGVGRKPSVSGGLLQEPACPCIPAKVLHCIR